METTFAEMDSILNRTKSALAEFMAILIPIVENAKDEHERLFWHHIYEEEEHRSDRLALLMPKIEAVLKNEWNPFETQSEFVHLLQDISLEKFGLHNFLEHIDLFLYQFKDTEYEEKIRPFRDMTYKDYQQMKLILEKLNQEFQDGFEFNTSVPTDEKEGKDHNVKVSAYANDAGSSTSQPRQRQRKALTVGSLKQN